MRPGCGVKDLSLLLSVSKAHTNLVERLTTLSQYTTHVRVSVNTGLHILYQQFSSKVSINSPQQFKRGNLGSLSYTTVDCQNGSLRNSSDIEVTEEGRPLLQVAIQDKTPYKYGISYNRRQEYRICIMCLTNRHTTNTN